MICPGCDFILDTSFLGEEILDEERTLRPGPGGVDPGRFNLADAVILGDIEDTAQSFETSDSGFHVKETTGARLYVSGQSQALMAPDAIPAVLADASPNVRLTPFERHVLSYIDGERPVERIRIEAGLDESEVKTALATLADKGVVQVIGRALVDLEGVQRQNLPRKRGGRRRLPTGLVPMVGISDETDRAIEEAFQTQTGLSPLLDENLDLPDDDDRSGVFSPKPQAEDKPTHELQSLASSATPPDPRPRVGPRPTVDEAGRESTFVPVTNTQAPDNLSASSDGFDDFEHAASFGDATGLIQVSSANASSAVSEVDDAFEDASFSGFDVGTEAIQRIANSELARQSIGPDDVFSTPPQAVRPEDGNTRATKNPLGSSLSRLLSDAADLSDIDVEAQGAFRSSGETPALGPRGTIASVDEGDEDFGGDEYSSEEAPGGLSSADNLSGLDHRGPPTGKSPSADLLDAFSDSMNMSLSDEQDSFEPEPVRRPAGAVAAGTLPKIGASSDAADFEAHNTRAAPLSDDGPALSELVGGFADASILGSGGDGDGGVFAGGDDPSGLDDDESEEPVTGPLTDSVKRAAMAAAQSLREDESLSDVSEKTNILAAEDRPVRAAARALVADGGLGEPDGGATVMRPPQGPPAAPAERARSVIVSGMSDSDVEHDEDDDSVEYIDENQIVGTRRISMDSARRLSSQASDGADASSVDASSVEGPVAHSEISALAPGDPGYVGSGVEGDFAEDSIAENVLPSSLLEDQAEDPHATAFVSQPSSVGEMASDGGWTGEGTVNIRELDSQATGYDSDVSERDGSSSYVSSSYESSAPPRGTTGLSAHEMEEKARKLFREALKDHAAGRVSRARMNAKLASVYDPHNEEYRAALDQWDRGGDRPQTDGKPEEVILYEEAQRIEGEGDIDGAIELLQQGIALNPRIAAFHNRLGVILAIRKQEYIDAARCVRRAVQLEPDNMHYMSNLGKIEKKAQAQGRARAG